MSRFADTSSSDTMMALLAVLTSPDDLKAKLDNLREQERQANERIALAGEADQVIIMRDNLVSLQREAVDELERAKVQAHAIVEEGKRKASEIVSDAQNSSVLMQVQADEYKKQAELDIKSAQEKLERDRVCFSLECQEHEQAIAERQSHLDKRHQELLQTENALEEIRAQLTSQENALNVRDKNLERFQRDVSSWHAELSQLAEHITKEVARIAR